MKSIEYEEEAREVYLKAKNEYHSLN